MFLSILLRKSIFVFLALFVLWFAEFIIGVFEVRIKLSGLTTQEQMKNALQSDFFISKIFPLGSMSNLIPNPLVRLNTAKFIGFKYEFTYPTESLIGCIVWCAVFIVGSYLILKKRDW